MTAPQLTLLETVMRKIERVDVWLMNSGGNALDVFNVRQSTRILLPFPVASKILFLLAEIRMQECNV